MYRVELKERKSLVIFDEVQRFLTAREMVKYLVADGRCDYIETGSLISINENDTRPLFNTHTIGARAA